MIFTAPSNIYRRDERREESCLLELWQGCTNFCGLRQEQPAGSLPNHTGLIGAEEVTTLNLGKLSMLLSRLERFHI